MKEEKKSHLPVFAGFDKEKNMYKWKCEHCKKEWKEPVDHSSILLNPYLYDGHDFLCVSDDDPWWFKQLNETERKLLKNLPEKKLLKFIEKMNSLRRSETKFTGIRNWVSKYEEIPIMNKSKTVIIDPLDIIKML